MNQNTQSDLGKLVLRLALGILILLHGIAKLKGGLSGI
jgi:putative oxidoreductase